MPDQAQAFERALSAGDLDALRRVPKADLHNHFFLGGDRDYLRSRTGRVVPRLAHKLEDMEEMHRWVRRHVLGVLEGRDGRRLALEACFAQARRDGVTVLEVGEDVWANEHLYEGRIELLIDTFQEVRRRVAPDIDFRFQIELSRHCPPDLLDRWAAPFLERDCFSSLDLSGDERSQPIASFRRIYRKAREQGLILKAHVGEWGDADSVQEAVETLELDEVQHGIAAASAPRGLKWRAAHRSQLNICPTSNVMMGRVERLDRHPIRILFDHGVPVTIASDAVLVFGRSVSEEYLGLYQAGLFTAQELDAIRRRGLESRSDARG